MFKTCSVCAAVLTLLLSYAWQGWAENKEKTEPKNKGGDAEFAFKATEINLAEINLGRLAIERAGSPEVKAYGQHMVTDHTKSLDELLKIASKKGFKTAMKMDEKHEAISEELSRLSGEKFDTKYMSHMAMGHKRALAAFQQEAKNGMDGDLKGYAARTVPVIQEHLKKAERLASGKDAKTGAR